MTTETTQSNANLAPLPHHVPEHLVFDFDMYNPPNLSAGVQEAWAVLQGPNVPDLVWTRCNGGHWIATRGQLIREGYEDYTHFSSACPLIPRKAGEAYDFIPTSMDPPQQRPFRALASQLLGMPVVDKLESRMQELAGSLIDNLRLQGQCNFTEDYAELFPVRVFFQMLAELPEEDIPHLKSLTDQVTRPDGSMTFEQARDALYEYLIPVIEQRRQKPGTDVISRVANGQINGRLISFDEAKRMCGLLLIGGLDTVVNFLSFIMEFLAKSPEHRRELVEYPERIPAACEELLRRFSLVADGRILTSDYEFHGVQLKKGDQILLPQILSGLDERENACPMHVDFSREKVSHTTFGHGSHLCLGQHLARREIIITLKEWLARIPDFAIAPGVQIRYQSGIVNGVQSLPLVWDPATTKAV